MHLRNWAIGLMAISATTALAADSLDRDLSALIDSYELPWMPDGKPLNGVRVALDASGGGRGESELRSGDDLSLLVTLHLYHLIHESGGQVTLTRTGDHPFSVTGPEDVQARADFILSKQPQIVMVFDGQCGMESMAACPGNSQLVQSLTNTLVEDAQIGVLSNLLPGVALKVQSADVPVISFLIRRPCIKDGWTQKPETFRKPARQIYDALLNVAQEHDLLDPVRQLTKDEREAISRRHSVWPADGDLPLERLDWFVHEFARRSVSTHSVTLFKPQAELSGDTVVLSGITNEPRLMKSLENALAAVGVTQLDNQIRILPDEQTLAGKLYGVCTAPQALTYAGPATRSSLQSQLLYGETVMLLDKQGDEYLLHGGDGYWGWVTASAIRPFDAEEFAKYLNLPQLAVTDELILDNGERIPAGARLPIVKNNSQRKDATFVVLLASGEEVEINDQHVRLLNDSRTARLRVEHALQFLHTPYVFGGRSPLGMDCSGLVTNVCSQLGEVPARDAWQQVMAGRLVATPWNRENIRPGDLLFYINRNGRIYHTGVALSNEHVIHASDPCVRINSSQRGDRLFEERLERDFFMAKRP
jgi:cell wall-associated NlpC family hydrolase